MVRRGTGQDGYLIVKYSEKGGYFLGCSSYKTDNTGCNCTISMRDYYKMMEYPWSESVEGGGTERSKTYFNKNSKTKVSENVAETAEDNDKKKNWEQEMMNQANEQGVETDRFLQYRDYNVFQIIETVLHITNMGLTYKEHLTPRNTRSLVARLIGDSRTDGDMA